MAVALSAVDAESGLDPLRHSLKHKAVLVGMFISLGLGFVIGGSYPFHYFAFVTIPLAIVLNAVRAALLACMQWNDEGDLSDEKRYDEFCREKKNSTCGGNFDWDMAIFNSDYYFKYFY